MNKLHIVAIYLGFFGLIAFATYYTNNANCLWALLLMPSYSDKTDGCKCKEKEE